jgi:Na+-transporting NADH:ubiquinone oxidoreductase subunit F
MSEILLGSTLFTLIIIILVLLIIGIRAIILPAKNVKITINNDKILSTKTGQKLLNALNDGGVPVPSACAGAGTCGLCRVKILCGAGDILPTEKAHLSPSEVNSGMRLACQVVIRNDIELKISDDILEVQSWQCKVRSTRSLSPLIKEIILDFPDDVDIETINLRAGSFFQITAPPYELDYSKIEISSDFSLEWKHLGLSKLGINNSEPVVRAYSIANRPQDKGVVVLNIRLAIPPPKTNNIPPGIVSSWLFSLRKNDKVQVAGPYGDFGALSSEREMIFIGGGVGMAPLRAIIFDQLERLGTKRKISFWYGARSYQDIFYEDDFNRLAKKHNNFSWNIALSEPRKQDNWQGLVGFIHEVVKEKYLKKHQAPQNCEYYLCGPPLMINTVFAMLEELGVENDMIFFDDFGG